MLTAPFVSILMTAYNRAEFIGEAIESVLKSTYKNFELIIVDDCSTDNTVAIAQSFACNDNRIKLYVNQKRLGQFPNRNKASEYAQGEFLMFADSDDLIFSDGVENCVKAMLAFPQSSFGMFSTSLGIPPFILNSEEAIRQHFFSRPFLTIGPGGTIIRRLFFYEINKYPINYGVPGDMYFNLKATCFSPVVLLPFEFMYYRRHEGQEINNSYSYLVYNYVYLRDGLANLPLPLEKKEIDWLGKKNKRRFFVNLIRYFIRTRNRAKTREALSLSGFSFKDALTAVFQAKSI